MYEIVVVGHGCRVTRCGDLKASIDHAKAALWEPNVVLAAVYSMDGWCKYTVVEFLETVD